MSLLTIASLLKAMLHGAIFLATSAMQFYSWEMLISEISEVFGNFTSLKSRIALQVAREIAPCNMALTYSILTSQRSNKVKHLYSPPF